MKSIRKIPCEIMTRTVGYFSWVLKMNLGKQEEVSERHMNSPKEIEEALANG